MLILPRYNDIFGSFTAISLYRESRYNDLIPLLPWHIVISGFHCIIFYTDVRWAFSVMCHAICKVYSKMCLK